MKAEAGVTSNYRYDFLDKPEAKGRLSPEKRSGLRCRKAIGFSVFFPVIFRTGKKAVFRFPVCL